MEADWSIALGVLTFIIAIIFAIVFYVQYKKASLIVFTASIATYIFAVFYAWDIFEPSKNGVLALLLISTVVMFGLGKYFSNVQILPAKVHTSLKEKNKKE